MINGIGGVTGLSDRVRVEKTELAASHQPFANVLKVSLNKVSQLESTADKMTDQLVRGEMVNLHDVMITAEKAKVTVGTAVQIQQKVIDTYNEIMRMQI